MSRKHSRLLRYVPAIAVLVSISLVTGGAFAVYQWLLSQEPDDRKVIQQITVIAPPPPPPPEIEEPPPPEIEEEVQIPDPETPEDLPDLAEDIPSGDQLGLDAEGGAGGDAFGLVGKKGGRGLLAGNPFGWYTGKVRDEIVDLLSEDRELKRKGYEVRIKMVIGRDGEVQGIRLAGSTGDEKLDRKLQLALSRIDRVSEPPPLEVGTPAPLIFQLRNRI